MCDRIPYKTIVTCELGDEEALKTSLKHYEPMIVESELTMATMMKYDPTRIPRKRNNKNDTSGDNI